MILIELITIYFWSLVVTKRFISLNMLCYLMSLDMLMVLFKCRIAARGLGETSFSCMFKFLVHVNSSKRKILPLNHIILDSLIVNSRTFQYDVRHTYVFLKGILLINLSKFKCIWVKFPFLHCGDLNLNYLYYHYIILISNHCCCCCCC